MPPRCPSTATYQRRQTEHTVLYRTIQAHLPTFLAPPAGDAERSGLPAFVKREFEAYLRCGILGHGFTRLRCVNCACEHLLPFSCKRRGFCPSYGGRRMAERATYLVDEVLPRVPCVNDPNEPRAAATGSHRTVWRDGSMRVLDSAISGPQSA